MGIFKKTTKETKKETVSKAPSASLLPAHAHTPRVIIRPHVSEKATDLKANGTYVFLVRNEANKVLVRNEVERRYGVKVKGVRMLRTRGEMRRFRGVRHTAKMEKKAMVTLVPGSKIDLE